jgi:hypothetical protein
LDDFGDSGNNNDFEETTPANTLPVRKVSNVGNGGNLVKKALQEANGGQQ